MMPQSSTPDGDRQAPAAEPDANVVRTVIYEAYDADGQLVAREQALQALPGRDLGTVVTVIGPAANILRTEDTYPVPPVGLSDYDDQLCRDAETKYNEL